MMTCDEINKLREDAVRECDAAKTLPELETVRIKYVGRNGLLPQIMKGLKDVEPDQRSEYGRAANEFKNQVSAALDSRKAQLAAADEGRKASCFDYSLPGVWRQPGTKHPISSIIEETIRIFGKLGFTVAEGPDVETSFRNFEALNTPAHHPSLDKTDTFWLETGELLRTQTSPVQIRVMEKQKPPVRIITPGRCYRRDTTDATHSANFHQVEGLYVDRNVSLADLKGVLAYFAAEMMGSGVQVRFRPHFFPFTEPSVECDFSCHVCGGKGCRVCKNSGWIEIAGAGMVDPRVFEKVGYDAEEFTGYAFGMGIERIAMIKYGINDIRLLYENDARFLGQFR
jgi:phenylalanyl-tRNA synthetase alpha chain